MNQIETPAAGEAGRPPVKLRPPGPPPEKRQIPLLIFVLLLSAAFYFLFSHFVLMTVVIKGASMSPTLFDGERYILYRCTYLWRAPRQGEIVVIKDPQDNDLSIKRIIGRPNDVVEIRHDGVYVNSAKLEEPYLASFAYFASRSTPLKPTKLGKDDYFVMGDNRGRSADSRIYGPVHSDHILGLIAKSN
jgi:signal peptidase I